LHENLASRAQVKSVFGEPIAAGEKNDHSRGSDGLWLPEAAAAEWRPVLPAVKAEVVEVPCFPLGVFEVSPKKTRFVPIGDRTKLLGTLLLGPVVLETEKAEPLIFASMNGELERDFDANIVKSGAKNAREPFWGHFFRAFAKAWWILRSSSKQIKLRSGLGGGAWLTVVTTAPGNPVFLG
jgi:hypothetical protein